MNKVKEYRRRAEECRALEKSAPAELRHHYEELATMWDRMADERLAFFVPEQARVNGHDNDNRADLKPS